MTNQHLPIEISTALLTCEGLAQTVMASNLEIAEATFAKAC